MSKGLDLIERQQPEIIDGFPTGNIYIGVTKEELTELEQELKEYEKLKEDIKKCSCWNEHKVLEIIKKKEVDVYKLFSCFEENGLEKYNNFMTMLFCPECHLTQEEYELLKEVLL